MAVIVISGVPCAGSSTIAALLSEKLHMRFFSVGDYYKKQAKKRLDLKNNTENTIGFLKDKTGGSADFHLDLDELQRGVAKEGNVVIEGKLSIHMLEGLWDFSVWISAAPEIRAQRAYERDGLPVAEALKKIKERESLERKLWAQVYGYDYFQQEKEASLVINTSDKTPDEIVSIILGKMPGKKGL